MSNRYLDILGLSPGVSKNEIKNAYRTLAKKYHPDVNTGADAARRFVEIAEAYRFLMDLGPRPNHESVNYDYNPYADQYIARRERAQAYAAKKRQEVEAQQIKLNRVLYRIFDTVAVLLIAANGLFIVDYFLVPHQYSANITEASQIYSNQQRVHEYDEIVVDDMIIAVEKGVLFQGATLFGECQIFVSPILGGIKSIEALQDSGTAILQPKQTKFAALGVLIPIVFLACLVYSLSSKAGQTRMTIGVLLAFLILIEYNFVNSYI